MALLYLLVRFRSTPGWTMGGRGAVWRRRRWDYVSVNVRLRKEAEEALRHEVDGNDGNGYRGRGGKGGGKKGTRFVEWSLSW